MPGSPDSVHEFSPKRQISAGTLVELKFTARNGIPATDIEGRSPVHLKRANVSYEMSALVSDRLSRSAFLFLYSGEQKYKEAI